MRRRPIARLTTILAVVAVGLAVLIVLTVVRDLVGGGPKTPPSSAPSPSGSPTIGPLTGPSALCRAVQSGDVDLIARHAACEEACRAEDMPACGLAATDYVTGMGAPPDGARASELYEKACASRRAPSACLLLGHLHHDGVLVPRDDERAAQAWSRGCAGGDRDSCAKLDGGR